jgi:hypothetical protein
MHSSAGRLTRGLTGFIAIENILDTVYDTGRTPIRTIGWPRTVRFGVAGGVAITMRAVVSE